MAAVKKLDVHSASSDYSKTYVFHEEDHTVGNALRHVLMRNPDVDFCGYTIPHPSEPKMHIRLQTRPGVPSDDTLRAGITDLRKVSSSIADAYRKELKAFNRRQKKNYVCGRIPAAELQVCDSNCGEEFSIDLSILCRMGRHQRRGYVGQTNLSPPHKLDSLSPSRLYADPLILMGSHSPTTSLLKPPVLGSQKRQPKVKWRLDLQPLPHDPGDGRHPLIQHGDNTEAQLAANIEAVQHDRKSFKDELWYRSPIGAGSKSSVVLAALKQQNHRDTGFLPRSSILNALQQSHIGLSEHQIQTLLRRYDPAQELIHYKTFVKHLHFTEANEPTQEEHDVIYRHQTYLEKIHQHAASMIQQSNEAASILGAGSPSKSPLRLSPVKPSATMITNSEPNVIVGNSPMHSPSSRLEPLGFERQSPSRYELEGGFDPLGFENDKRRKAQRAQAKATVLLAHISRIDDYTRHQDVVTLQHDNLRIASKALHHGEHLARVFDEQHRQQHRLENQGKALVDSPLKQAQRSVSKDSMFYVDTKGG